MSEKDIHLQKGNKDYIVHAMAGNGQIRAAAVTGRNLTEYARKSHNASPVATAALGRTMCAALMMGSEMLKEERDLLTIRIDGDGPLGSIVVTADRNGHVKGYVGNPGVVLLEPNSQGHLNVGKAVGKGTLTVIRDLDLKNAYTGQVALHSGEIADDLTYYFAESEQVPSSVGLGVLMNQDLTVACAGGFIIQLMPFASDECISQLEKTLKNLPTVTDLLCAGNTPEEILKTVLTGFDVEFTGTQDASFYCDCSRERVERAVILLGENEVQKMIDDGRSVDLRCQFCGKKYTFSVDQLKALKIRAASSTAKRSQIEEDR